MAGGRTDAAGPAAVTVQDLADTLGTISYEVLCLLGATNPRLYV